LGADALEAVAAIDDPRELSLDDMIDTLREAADLVESRNRAAGFGDALEPPDTEDASSSGSKTWLTNSSPDPDEEAEEDEPGRPDEADNDEAALLHCQAWLERLHERRT